jgi:plasmid replication initiation protein
MPVISGGVRTDTGWRYQVHQMDLHQFVKGLTKATFRIDRHEDIVSTIFRAYDIATSDEPGSVFLERVKASSKKLQTPRNGVVRSRQFTTLAESATLPSTGHSRCGISFAGSRCQSRG